MGVRLKRDVAALTVLLASAACKKSSPGGPPPGGAPPSPEVTIVTVAPANVPLTYEFSAQVLQDRRDEIRPRVEGIIERRLFTEGAVVKEGQLLYKIESAKYASAMRAAQARVDAAKLRLARYEPLLANHAVAKQDVDEARAELEAAESELTQTKRDFDDTTVRAEMTGRVGRTMLEVGARVAALGDLLTTIDRLDPVYVSFRPSSQQVLEWSRDAGARAHAPRRRPRGAGRAARQHRVRARASFDFSSRRRSTSRRTQEFRALSPIPTSCSCPASSCALGSSASRPTTRSPFLPCAPCKPRSAGSSSTSSARVTQCAHRDVVPGAWAGTRWIIKSGLNAGDRVVVDGIQKVGPGRPVRPRGGSRQHSEGQAAEGRPVAER